MQRASAKSEIATASPLPVASINIYVFLTYSTHAGIRGILLFPFVRIVRRIERGDWYQFSRNQLDNYLEFKLIRKANSIAKYI